MTRVLMTVAFSVILPAAAAAQVTIPPNPVVPPAPPAPTAAPLPSITPPVAIAPIPATLIRDDLFRTTVEAQAIREAVAHARLVGDQIVAVRPEIRDAVVLANSFDLFEYQPRWSAEQDPGGSYSSGLSAISQKQWDRAISQFDRAIAQKSPRSDGAMYWKAYALYRNNQVPDALTTIAALQKSYGQSPYLKDAKALEADVRKTPPQDILDDDIKLLAISAQQHSTEPDRAIGLLEGVLTTTNSLRVKQRALYVLALIPNPRSRQILLNYAKGAGLPDLQATAIQYLAQDKKTTAEELRSIYESTTDQRIKAAIINAYQSTGNRSGLLGVVNESGAPVAMRQQAMNGLTGILSPQDLWQLYEKEADPALRRQIVAAFGSMRAIDQLSQAIRTEKDVAVRRRAIQSLGSLKSEQSGPMLVDLYGRETDLETKRAIVAAFSSQNNAEALVAIAKKETSVPLRTEVVQKLSEMSRNSKVAADYMMEILKSGGR